MDGPTLSPPEYGIPEIRFAAKGVLNSLYADLLFPVLFQSPTCQSLKNISTCFDVSWEVLNKCVNTKKDVDSV